MLSTLNPYQNSKLLTKNEIKVLGLFAEADKEKFLPPTAAELTRMLGCKSENAAVTIVKKLTKLNYLKKSKTCVSRGTTINKSYPASILNTEGEDTGEKLMVDSRMFRAPPHYLLRAGCELIAVHRIGCLSKEHHGDQPAVRLVDGKLKLTQVRLGSATKRLLHGLDGVHVGSIINLPNTSI